MLGGPTSWVRSPPERYPQAGVAIGPLTRARSVDCSCNVHGSVSTMCCEDTSIPQLACERYFSVWTSSLSIFSRIHPRSQRSGGIPMAPAGACDASQRASNAARASVCLRAGAPTTQGSAAGAPSQALSGTLAVGPTAARASRVGGLPQRIRIRSIVISMLSRRASMPSASTTALRQLLQEWHWSSPPRANAGMKRSGLQRSCGQRQPV
mmetsp:Transcript_47929/g.133178  ORF Transcript_47929/g.133178 Transcript_47929/m.133178 type:complete len:209 (-) Transcript_47929:332-958(-)